MTPVKGRLELPKQANRGAAPILVDGICQHTGCTVCGGGLDCHVCAGERGVLRWPWLSKDFPLSLRRPSTCCFLPDQAFFCWGGGGGGG